MKNSELKEEQFVWVDMKDYEFPDGFADISSLGKVISAPKKYARTVCVCIKDGPIENDYNWVDVPASCCELSDSYKLLTAKERAMFDKQHSFEWHRRHGTL